MAWYLDDRLGSVGDIINNSSAVLNHVDYTAYGQVAGESMPAQGDRFKYAGMESDVAVGLYYDRARYYDPTAGKFASQDPSGFSAGDSNLYRYASNGVTNSNDVTGLDDRRRNDLRPDMRIDDGLRGRGHRAQNGWGFDGAGGALFFHWLGGEGTPINTLNGDWGEYMRRNKMLPDQIKNALMKWTIRTGCPGGKVDIKMAAEIENGYSTGYEMLHGTSDFRIQGTGECINGHWHFKVRMTWNDRIDPNYGYAGDFIAIPIYILTPAQDYDVSISWDQEYDFDY